MRVRLGYAAMAAVVAVIGALGWIMYAAKSVDTKTVTKTRVAQARYAGPESLVRFLHPKTAQQTQCPKGAAAGVTCAILASEAYYIYAAFAPEQSGAVR